MTTLTIYPAFDVDFERVFLHQKYASFINVKISQY